MSYAVQDVCRQCGLSLVVNEEEAFEEAYIAESLLAVYGIVYTCSNCHRCLGNPMDLVIDTTDKRVNIEIDAEVSA